MIITPPSKSTLTNKIHPPWAQTHKSTQTCTCRSCRRPDLSAQNTRLNLHIFSPDREYGSVLAKTNFVLSFPGIPFETIFKISKIKLTFWQKIEVILLKCG